MTSVFARFLKKQAKMPKKQFFREDFSKFAGRVRTHPNASRCIRTHPNASERIRTGPSKSKASKNFRNHQKTYERLAKISQKLSRMLVNMEIASMWFERNGVDPLGERVHWQPMEVFKPASEQFDVETAPLRPK